MDARKSSRPRAARAALIAASAALAGCATAPGAPHTMARVGAGRSLVLPSAALVETGPLPAPDHLSSRNDGEMGSIGPSLAPADPVAVEAVQRLRISAGRPREHSSFTWRSFDVR